MTGDADWKSLFLGNYTASLIHIQIVCAGLRHPPRLQLRATGALHNEHPNIIPKPRLHSPVHPWPPRTTGHALFQILDAGHLVGYPKLFNKVLIENIMFVGFRII